MRRIFLRFFLSVLGAMFLALSIGIGLTLWLIPRPPGGELHEAIRPIAGMILLVRTVPALVCIGCVCYLLARQMARPMEKLRTAIRGFAAGDLDQRVSHTLGHRRDEIGQLARDFDAMAERIATLLSSQQRLLRDISHELRSPLARQQIAIELVRERLNDPRATTAIDRVELEAERLNDLIAELLTLARIDNDAERETPGPVDLADVVRSVVEDAHFEATRRERSVRLVECQSCVVEGTQSVLRRAIENVVRNAVRYTADGTSVEVRVSVDAQATICVRDHGPGVAENALSDIFRPFFRVDDARGRESGGTGIGLAITHRAIQRHGGAIRARNADDGGLEVEMTLPLAAEGGDDQPFGAARVESHRELR
ncbi:MAG TPA: ATP-binding protein [Phycisphaerae bacterium]|nr:ATP-binding protein [Phycisphaerae bacterium]HRW54231.1 ATP-binding protein [Phycisphaerae bacterium]